MSKISQRQNQLKTTAKAKHVRDMSFLGYFKAKNNTFSFFILHTTTPTIKQTPYFINTPL
jgi:hypothetical protein